MHVASLPQHVQGTSVQAAMAACTSHNPIPLLGQEECAALQCLRKLMSMIMNVYSMHCLAGGGMELHEMTKDNMQAIAKTCSA